MNYQETVEYLYTRLPVFHHVGKAAFKANLNNILALCEKLDNPHLKFSAIHVAGTNGKGSVSHMLASVLQKAGYRTALYTSPHLLDFCERIKINGKEISQNRVVEFVEKNQSLIESLNPSFFELITAMAFDFFAKEKVDIAIIETGLGGRLDATNIIHPILSVITNISFDHQDILGDTLGKIAAEKAGIIKEKVPVVVGETHPETKKIFIEKALENDSSIVFADKTYKAVSLDFNNYNRKIEVSNIGDGTKRSYDLDLPGKYQEKNIQTVLAAIDHLPEEIKIAPGNIFEGLKETAKQTGLKGRWQVLHEDPLVITDTGHNEAGLHFIADQLKELRFGKLHMVFGMVKDKDVKKALNLLPRNADYYFTKANVIRALNETELKNLAQSEGIEGKAFVSISEAIQNALVNAKTSDVIFVGGSTFVAAEAIELFKNKVSNNI